MKTPGLIHSGRDRISGHTIEDPEVADRFISPDRCPLTEQVDYFLFARHPSGMRRSAAEPVTRDPNLPGDPNLQGAVAQSQADEVCLQRSKRRAWTIGCYQHHRGSWQALSARRFPQLSGAVPWRPSCRPRDWCHAVDNIGRANPSPQLVQKENIEICP